MQLVKMFASLGFNIDMEDVLKFEGLLNRTKTHMKEFAVSTQAAHKSVTALTRKMNGLNASFEGSNVAAATTKYQKAFNNYSVNVGKMQGVLEKFIPVADSTLLTIKRVSVGVDKGAAAWLTYAERVNVAKTALFGLKRELVGATAARREANAVTNIGGFGRGAVAGAAGFSLGESMLGKFAKPMLPSVMTMGMSALAAGYAVKETIVAGQKGQALESLMLSVSDSAKQARENIQYTFQTAQKLGLDWIEFGESFASIFSAAKHHITLDATKKMMEGITAEMAVLHMSVADQKSVFLGIRHAFDVGTIHARQFNMVALRMPVAMRLLEQAAHNVGIKFKNIPDAMSKGLLDTSKIMPEFGRLMKIEAEKNNALELSMHTSRAELNRLHNSYMKFSADLAEAGSDSAVGALIAVLATAAEKMEAFVLWTFKGIKGIAAWAKEFPNLAKGVGIVAASLIALRIIGVKTLYDLVGSFVAATAGTYATSGAIGVLQLAFVALKRAIVATGIGALIVGLIYAGQSYYDYLHGEDNWINYLIGQLEILKAQFKLLGAEASLAWQIIKTGGGTESQRSGLFGAANQKDSMTSDLGDKLDYALALTNPALGISKLGVNKVLDMFNSSSAPSSAAPTQQAAPIPQQAAPMYFTLTIDGKQHYLIADTSKGTFQELPAGN